MSWALFVDSSNGVIMNPEYSFVEDVVKIENRFRSRDGSEYVYKWSDYDKWKIPVLYVNSSFKAVVNSWWRSNTDLLLKSESASAVYSVHLTNKGYPITQAVKPYDTLFKGIIEVEVY